MLIKVNCNLLMGILFRVFQLKRLADNGEESIVLLATSGSLPSSPAICTKLGGEFFKKESNILHQIGKKFQSYCQGQYVPLNTLNTRDKNS